MPRRFHPEQPFPRGGVPCRARRNGFASGSGKRKGSPEQGNLWMFQNLTTSKQRACCRDAPPRTVRDEGIRVVKALVERAGVVRAVGAEPDSAVLQRAASDAAALIALPAAAAGTVSAQLHRAQRAVQPAERKTGAFPHKSPHFLPPAAPDRESRVSPAMAQSSPASSMSSTRM